MFTVTVDGNRARRALRNARRRAKAGPSAYLDVGKMSAWALARAKQRSPNDTGEFQSLWQIDKIDGKTWDGELFRLVNTHPAAKAIIYGTRAHWIEPLGGLSSALKFDVGGETVFASSVYHPGTKPNRVDSVVFAELGKIWPRFKKER